MIFTIVTELLYSLLRYTYSFFTASFYEFTYIKMSEKYFSKNCRSLLYFTCWKLNAVLDISFLSKSIFTNVNLVKLPRLKNRRKMRDFCINRGIEGK